MLSALALTTFLITAKSGDAFSGIGQHYNTAWEAVYDHSQSAVKNPHLTKAVRHHRTTTRPAPRPAQRPAATSSSSGQGFGSAALGDIPGVPYSFASCVAYRESTNGTNPAAHGNVYGIIPASGYNVSGDSLAQQKLVFKQIYDTSGPRAWAADGC
jgi:hypothetical protein